MLPCPFPRELPLYSIRQTRRPPLSYRTAAGGRCYLPDPVPEPRHAIVFRGFRRTDRVSTRDATDESTFPWPHVGAEVFSTSGPIGRQGLTNDAIASRRRPAAPRHHTAADRRLRTPSRRADCTPVKGVRSAPGEPARTSSPEPDPRNSVPFVSFLLSLPDRQRCLPRSHSKGITFFIACARSWEGCLDVDCFTPTPNQPNLLILSLTSPGRSSIPQEGPTCIFID